MLVIIGNHKKWLPGYDVTVTLAVTVTFGHGTQTIHVSTNAYKIKNRPKLLLKQLTDDG